MDLIKINEKVINLTHIVYFQIIEETVKVVLSDGEEVSSSNPDLRSYFEELESDAEPRRGADYGNMSF